MVLHDARIGQKMEGLHLVELAGHHGNRYGQDRSALLNLLLPVAVSNQFQ